ncbi:RNA polymerase sigma factor, sigma-70 family protein [Latilactobacillus curvatus CRL 705]|nr:RNA polymerase sigma factor, sigma-70 family protein [Latilactobacillus curvatus CRL 705]
MRGGSLMELAKRDANLIQAVVENDSEALDVLFKAYLPMVYRTFTPYYIRLFDEDDWLQEARIVCYETCQCYDQNCGKSFGGFYKLRFHHHVLNLIRKELAQKRRVDQQALLFDCCPECNALAEDTVAYYQSTVEMRAYLETLSALELVAFRVLTGQLAVEQACSQLDCTFEQMKRAQSRCQTKLKRFYTKQ